MTEREWDQINIEVDAMWQEWMDEFKKQWTGKRTIGENIDGVEEAETALGESGANIL